MGKRAQPQLYAGSLVFNFWQYITHYQLFINPKDYYAMRYAVAFSNGVNTARIKFPDPNIFIRLHLIDGKDNHSHALVTWNTKMQKKIYIHYGHTAIDDLMNHIKYYNKICEDVRNMEGEDDEPEDETKFLI